MAPQGLVKKTVVFQMLSGLPRGAPARFLLNGLQSSRILAVMPNARELYVSSNGDRWHLIRAPDGDDVFVQHTANEASGGKVVDIAIPVFLGLGRHGPEHQELWRLIGTLVEQEP